MKQTTVSILFLVLITNMYGQNPRDIKGYNLPERTELSEAIVEGIVVGKSCFEDARGMIWTRNSVLVSKIFKGETIGDTVVLVTGGGTIGNRSVSLSHNTILAEGEEGLFFAAKRVIDNKEMLMPYYPRVTYYQDGVNHSLTDGYHKYKNLEKDVFAVVEKLTRKRNNLKPNCFERKMLNCLQISYETSR